MYLSSIYLIVNNFEKSIAFYEKLLEIPLENGNNGRFVSFAFEGHRISLLNGHFDAENPERIVRKDKNGETNMLREIALAPNTHKFAFNFWVDDLRVEYKRIKELNIAEYISSIKYFCYVAPYYYFQLADPDGNTIEVTGSYMPKKNEFDE